MLRDGSDETNPAPSYENEKFGTKLTLSSGMNMDKIVIHFISFMSHK